ncbi:MAG TPA: serine hydrolase [Xanthobacteraceae bacterium]|nr:serine hydrolase [Xanthobacteraceae bacterium]
MKALRAPSLGIALGSIVLSSIAVTLLAATPARSEALILVDVESGKVLRAENATYPWYPASTTKLMTLYMTLSAVRDHKITFDTLFTVSKTASAQSPTKMGFPVGTQVTVDNALKMMMVKSANDMAVLLAEGIGGSVDGFAQEMTDTAHQIGMTESNFVNPNGLPADGQITSARDLAILARALIREFPEYSFYWHIPAIRWGNRIVRNYNPLLGRYPGTDGMKTGFICASGFNLVATATRNNKQLIAVVLGAPSGAVRAVKAAEMLEGGFAQNPLSWLLPALGTVDALVPVNADPPNLKDEMCGPHRKRPASEDDDADAASIDSAAAAGDTSQQFSFLLSALRAPTPKNVNLLTDDAPMTPIVVYTGPTRAQPGVGTDVASEPGKKKAKKKTATAQPGDDNAIAAPATDKKAATTKPKDKKPVAGKSTGAKTPDGKSTDASAPAGANPWTPLSASALAATPPPELGGTPAAAPAPQKKTTPKPPAAQ